MKARKLIAMLLVVATLMSFAPMAVFAADGTAENKIVTVQYLFEDGEIAADPWTASIAAGSSLNQTINYPTIVGYEPSQSKSTLGSNATWGADALTLNITNITSDVTISVVYVPALVNYTVKFYQQNVDNDNYALAETLETTGYTGSKVSITADKYKGFYQLPYDTDTTIAADGSTVVEVYYDRNYYLLSFDLGGGYGVDPQFLRYGQTVDTVGTPTRPGYTFVGWDVEVPATMPANNLKLTAQWQAVESAKVTIVFWGENANDEQYSYLSSVETTAVPGTTVSMINCGLETHTHTAECGYACGKTEHTHSAVGGSCYTLTCTKNLHNHVDSGCAVAGCTHTHTTSCYSVGGYVYTLVETTKPDSITESNPVSGTVYTYTTEEENWFGGMTTTTHYYLYLDGKWYVAGSRYSSSTSDTQSITLSCTHTHDDSCYTCGIEGHPSHVDSCYTLTCTQEAHTHSASCGYSCGKTAHTHSADCEIAASGLSTTLWTLVRSDTATVAADGSTVINVYYDRTQFTLTFKGSSNYGGTGTTYGTITDKWGADIEDKFFDICEKAYETDGTYSWSEETDGSGPWTSYVGVMPQRSIIYYAYDASGTMTAYYYFETLDGQYNDEEGNVLTVKAEGSGFTVTDEDRAEFEGFTHDTSSSTSNGSSFNGAKFYYTRNSYNLVYISGEKELKVESIKYQAPLSGYDETYYSPEATADNMPAGYEVGAYTFGGWYTNPECTVAYDFANSEMPAKNVTVYAKWNPITHDVKVYKDNTLTEQIGTTQTVDHRAFATAPATPTNGAYTFVGWFYMDNGVEKAFDFASMQITKDMDIYAKWSSKTLVRYIINYTLEDGTVIADPTTGSILGGNTKTFDAKGGEDLYTNYQEGYFPKTSSHSLTAVLEGDDANSNGVLDANEYTFVYVQKDAVPYTVKYLDATTLEAVAEPKPVSNNRHAVVTEYAENVNGYLPDAFQKRLIVTDGGENVLIFYYTKDDTHALVTEKHTLVNGAIETEYSSSTLTGNIGESYSKTNYENGHIAGYVFDYAEVSYYVDGVLTTVTYTPGTELKLEAGGLHFEFFYKYNRFDVYYQGVDQTITYDLVDSFNAVAVSNTHDGYLYAGMYTDKTFTTPLETVGENAGDGMAFQPKAGATYYVKEINERYALPGLYLIWDERAENKLTMSKLFLMTAIDNNQYLEVGIELDYADNTKDKEIAVTSDESKLATDNTASNNYDALHEQFVAQFSEKNYSGVRTDTVTAANGFFGTASEDEKTKAGAANAYLYIYDFTAFVTNPEQVRFSGFFVTPDGIRVEGVKYRDLYQDSTIDSVETLTKNNFVRAASDTTISCTDKYPAASATVMSFAPLMMRSAYTITGDIVDTVTITKIDGDTTETQEVEPGDHIGAVTYTEKDGYIFAGWYTDEACTVAADFSDVQADMTVYAKYIAAKDVNVTLTGVGKYMSATITVPGTDVPALGLRYTLNGETTEVTWKQYNGILSAIAKLLGSKSETYTASWNMSQLANGDTFTVTAYWTTEDGTVVEIETESYICSRNRISVQ